MELTLHSKKRNLGPFEADLVLRDAILSNLSTGILSFGSYQSDILTRMELPSDTSLKLRIRNLSEQIRQIQISPTDSFSIELILDSCHIPRHISAYNTSNRSKLIFRSCNIESLSIHGIYITIENGEIRSLNVPRGNTLLNSRIAPKCIRSCDFAGSLQNLRFSTSFQSPFQLNTSELSEEIIFDSCLFDRPPVLTHLENIRTQKLSFSESVFKSTPLDEFNFRVLKEISRRHANDIDEALFAACEMASRHDRLPRGLEKTISFLYWLINDYGRAVFRPILHLIGLWLILFTSLAIWATMAPGLIARSDNSSFSEFEAVGPFMRAFFESLALSLGPLNLIGKFNVFRMTGIDGVAFAWFATILSSILWIFIISGIRKRFKTH